MIDTHAVGWKGLNQVFTKISNQSFQEGLSIYRAAWKRGLTTAEIDKLASASSIGERYDHGYWLKEKIFREIRNRLQEVRTKSPTQAASLNQLEKDLIRLYYTGDFEAYAKRISDVPGR